MTTLAYQDAHGSLIAAMDSAWPEMRRWYNFSSRPGWDAPVEYDIEHILPTKNGAKRGIVLNHTALGGTLRGNSVTLGIVDDIAAKPAPPPPTHQRLSVDFLRAYA